MKKYADMIYLDHNATTYMDERVLEVMLPYMLDGFANPSSIYRFSQEVKMHMENAREKMMELLGVGTGRLIMTGSGSESDNLAIKGAAYANKKKGKHIITSQIEHHAVLHACQYLEKQGFEVSYLPVDKQGIVSLEALKDAIREDTILISIMYANNETGVIQPIKEISNIAKSKGILFHTDAVQAVGKLRINVDESGVDLLTLSAHKFYGPKGVGALYVRKGVKLDPQVHGGEQEKGFRAGTENVAGIIGMAKALEIACEECEAEWEREKKMRDHLEDIIMDLVPECMVNGHKEKRLANTLNIIIKYVEGEGLILMLDKEKIYVSSGSACTSGSLEPSHVLLAMGVPHEFAHGSLRFSFGRYNEESDVDKVAEVLINTVNKLRELSPLWPPQFGFF